MSPLSSAPLFPVCHRGPLTLQSIPFTPPPLSPTQVALCALAQLFIVVTHPPLVRLLVRETLGSGGGGASGAAPSTAAAGASGPEVSTRTGGVGVSAEPETTAGSFAPLLALLQGDREELCLGALVVLQVNYGFDLIGRWL